MICLIFCCRGGIYSRKAPYLLYNLMQKTLSYFIFVTSNVSEYRLNEGVDAVWLVSYLWKKFKLFQYIQMLPQILKTSIKKTYLFNFFPWQSISPHSINYVFSYWKTIQLGFCGLTNQFSTDTHYGQLSYDISIQFVIHLFVFYYSKCYC